jgi:hypothetical protein
MREQATQKLSRAYRIDEIACSVATMQSASTLEDVASLVLQRSKEDADAKYVHFFHEKIPSRQLAECTNLDPLDEIIASRPIEAEALRTRATVRIFKDDFDGAAVDFTAALQVHRFNQPSHRSSRPIPQSRELQSAGSSQQQRTSRREDVILREEDQPSSFEQQVLFQRGGVYLTLASKHVTAALPDVSQAQHDEHRIAEDGQSPPTPPPEPSEESLKEARQKLLESRKLVKSYGRKALRDYIAFLSHFDYSPDVPTEVAEDFAKRVNHAVHGLRIPRQQQHLSRPEPHLPTSSGLSRHDAPHRTYFLSDLFAATPPADLPPYPRTDLVQVGKNARATPPQPDATGEALTYHPLLTDALHSLLLCHCLVQTSSKELQRHANMVARLARLADGYPVFQASRSPARADWVEVLRRGDNWINLAGTWEALCAPAPLPVFSSSAGNTGGSSGSSALAAASSPVARQPKALLSAPAADVPEESEKQRAERLHHQAMMSALEDDRVTDMDTLRAAVRAHKRRAEEDERRAKGQSPSQPSQQPAGDFSRTVEGMASAQDSELPDSPLEPNPSISGQGPPSTTKAPAKVDQQQRRPSSREKEKRQGNSQTAVPRRWAIDDGKEYPILTERAAAVARWVLEAPPVGADGAGRRKKKKAVDGAASKEPGSTAPAAGTDTEVRAETDI